MQRHPSLIPAVLAGSTLLLAACTFRVSDQGSDPVPRDAPWHTTVPSPTNPPTTGVPPVTTPPDGSVPAQLPDVEVVIDDGSYDTPAAMAADSSVVVLGDVVAVEALGRPDIGDRLDEYAIVRLEIAETLAGSPTQQVILGWKAFRTDPDGRRTSAYVTNGIRTPEPGDQLLLFLDPVDPDFADVLGNSPTHQLVRLDGMLEVRDGVVATGESGSPLVQQLIGRTVDDIRSALRA